MYCFWELMCAVSPRMVRGHFVSEDAIKKITHDYYFLITDALGLVNILITVPLAEFGHGKSKKASDMVMTEFLNPSAECNKPIEAGQEASCTMVAWNRSILPSKK